MNSTLILNIGLVRDRRGSLSYGLDMALVLLGTWMTAVGCEAHVQELIVREPSVNSQTTAPAPKTPSAQAPPVLPLPDAQSRSVRAPDAPASTGPVPGSTAEITSTCRKATPAPASATEPSDADCTQGLGSWVNDEQHEKLRKQCTAKSFKFYHAGKTCAEAAETQADLQAAADFWQHAVSLTFSTEEPVRMSRMALGELFATAGTSKANAEAICHFAAALSPWVQCHPAMEVPLSEVTQQAKCGESPITCEPGGSTGRLNADSLDKAALKRLGPSLCKTPSPAFLRSVAHLWPPVCAAGVQQGE